MNSNRRRSRWNGCGEADGGRRCGRSGRPRSRRLPEPGPLGGDREATRTPRRCRRPPARRRHGLAAAARWRRGSPQARKGPAGALDRSCQERSRVAPPAAPRGRQPHSPLSPGRSIRRVPTSRTAKRSSCQRHTRATPPSIRRWTSSLRGSIRARGQGRGSLRRLRLCPSPLGHGLRGVLGCFGAAG